MRDVKGYAGISLRWGDANDVEHDGGTLGKNLAVRVPFDVARSAGLSDGEVVEIELRDGDILIRRPAARQRARDAAARAAGEIMADGVRHSLGEVRIRDLLEEGRRG